MSLFLARIESVRAEECAEGNSFDSGNLIKTDRKLTWWDSLTAINPTSATPTSFEVGIGGSTLHDKRQSS